MIGANTLNTLTPSHDRFMTLIKAAWQLVRLDPKDFRQSTESNWCPMCQVYSMLLESIVPNHCDNCGGKLVVR